MFDKSALLILGFVGIALGDGFAMEMVCEERLWINWATNYERQIKSLFTPETQEELIELVQMAQLQGKSIKVLGGGHSLSAISLPDENGWAISLEKYSKVLALDEQKLTVTVQASITLRELNQILDEHGLALNNLASTADQTAGGLIQTGTHATGKNYGSLHTQVIEMTVINGKGELKTLNPNSHSTLFRAHQCGLGTLGIVDSVTFQAVPAFALHEVTYPSQWPLILDHIDDLLQKNDRFRFHWFPYANQVGVWTANPTKQPVSKTRKPTKIVSIEDLLEIDPCDPSTIARVNQTLFEADYSQSYERCDRSDQILLKFGERNNVYAAEASIPFSSTKPFFLDLQKLIEENHFPAHGGVEVRFVKADPAPLSPAFSENSDDLFCFINIGIIRPNGHHVPYQEYFEAFGKLVKRYQGRLHWGKMGHLDPDYLKQSYPRWEDFKTIQEQEDPSGIFLNEWSKTILD